MKKNILITLIGYILIFNINANEKQTDRLNRGVIALRTSESTAFISWRLLNTDIQNVSFDIYRTYSSGREIKLNDKPLSNVTNFSDSLANFQESVVYTVKIAGQTSDKGSGSFQLSANAPVAQYLTIPVNPAPGYNIGDGSAGDLDGDGEYELIIKREQRPRDNSHKGITGQTRLEAYKLNGKHLWTIDLGRNIREGAHYTPFMVFDLDGDGCAEIACKTADGTIDGKGNIIGDSTAYHRNADGHIFKGPEYLTVFDGKTGAEISTVNYLPGRHPKKPDPTPNEMKAIWGDDHYNRSERYLACVAYLDGKHPSLIMCRGYYTRSVITSWDFKNKKLSKRWMFDSDAGKPGNRLYRGQGNHNVSVADVDADGKDEIIYGACCIDDNGKGLYSTRLGHGDALHVSDLDPLRPGLEVFTCHETQSNVAGSEFRDARTGALIWGFPSEGDVGRALAANIHPGYPGSECWVFGPGMRGLYSAQGKLISPKAPRSCNFTVYWDGDLLQELLDRNFVAKYDWVNDSTQIILRAPDCRWNNGTKANPVLSADILGDWREEIIWRTADNSAIRIYSTTIPSEHRITTLMQDHVYRLGIAWQNTGYNQPPKLGYYPGGDKK